MALGRLIDGKWTTEWTERNESGEFKRMPTQFHQWITADGASGFKAEPGRYHLYVSLGCPWAHRTVLVRSLKGLHDVISGLFKCNLKRLVDYPNLWNYCRELYQHPRIAEWCSTDHVKRLYYSGLLELNPSGIVPLGPAIDFAQPHTRAPQRLVNQQVV